MLAVRDSTTIEDGAEIAAELQEDILKLTRQYRMLKEDRNAYVDETQRTLTWQGKIIADLMREEEELLKSLRPLRQKRVLIADKNSVEKLLSIVGSEDEIKFAIKEENSKLFGCDDAFAKRKQEIEVSCIK